MLEKTKYELMHEQGPIKNIADIFSGPLGKEFFVFIDDRRGCSGDECSHTIIQMVLLTINVFYPQSFVL